MKRHDELFSLTIGQPVRFDFCGQRADVARRVVIVIDEPELGQAAHLTSPGVHRIKHAGRGGGAVLRVGRQDQHSGCAAVL